MGFAFKENCPDLRNTRVIDIVEELEDYSVRVDVFDPWVDTGDAEKEYGIRPVGEPELGAYDAIILSVAHTLFGQLGAERIRAYGKPTHILYDLKYLFPRSETDLRL